MFDRLAGQQGTSEKSSVMEKYDLTKQEKRKLETSLTELCNRLKTISQQNIAATTPPVVVPVSHPVIDTVSSS